MMFDATLALATLALSLTLPGTTAPIRIAHPPGTSTVPAPASDAPNVRYIPDTKSTGDLLNIVQGPDGAMWFTESLSGAIGRIDASFAVTNYRVPAAAGVPVAIASGPDGNVWFTLGGGSKQGIGRITPQGKIKIFPFGAYYGTELGITAGPDGAMWFTDYTSNKVGRITTGGAITERALPGIGVPNGITVGPDGNLWICEQGALQGSHNEPGRILRLDAAGTFTKYLLTPHDWTTVPLFITTGADGNLWFSEYDYTATPYHVERITPQGTISSFFLGKRAEPPYGIALGPDGNIWMTESEYFIDRVTPAGVYDRLRMPQPPGTSIPAQPRGIAAGPLGDLWFVETTTGSIGVLPPSPH